MINQIYFLLFIATVTGFICCPALLIASAQGQPKGGFFLSLQPYYYSTDKYFDEHGDLHDRGGTFEKYEINPYMEYGLTDKDMLTINIFYDWLTDDVSGSDRKTRGFTDQEIGLQHQLTTGENGVLAVHGMFIVPAGYSIEDDPRLGYYRFGAEASLLYGQDFQLLKKYGFVDLRFLKFFHIQ